ncbi:non-specific lipid-transfer protein 8 [Fagus crenata]
MKSPKFAIPTIAVVVLLLLAPATEASISCSDVVKDLRPCLTYLQNGTGKPTAACCSGVSALASAASSSADKKAACACIKSAAKQINANAEAAKALPGDCGITLSFTISSNVDCSKCLHQLFHSNAFDF